MNFVEPIRDRQKLLDVQAWLKKDNPRNYIMIITGLYTGLRISDILKLKVKDVKDKDTIYLKEKKTSKRNIIAINKFLLKEYKWYCNDLNEEEYLIKSPEGVNKPITRVQAYNIIKEVGEDFNIQNLGTHSLRKTYGFHYYKQTKDIGTLMRMFNHSTPAITLKYIGVEQDQMNIARKTFSY